MNHRMIDSLPNSAGAVFADGAIQGTAHDRTRHFLTHLTIPPFGVMVMKPDIAPPGGYTNYKRVR
jgi:hypothetical protein